MMDEAIAFLRAWWGDASVDFDGDFFQARAMAMEPKPPQGASIPIWVGGASPAALRRAGTVADGWLASAGMGDSGALAGMIERVKEHAAAAGRDPSSLGFQAQLSPPPRSDDPGGRNFYRRPDDVVAVALAAKSAGFDAGRDQRHGRLPGRRAQGRCDDRGAGDAARSPAVGAGIGLAGDPRHEGTPGSDGRSG